MRSTPTKTALHALTPLTAFATTIALAAALGTPRATAEPSTNPAAPKAAERAKARRDALAAELLKQPVSGFVLLREAPAPTAELALASQEPPQGLVVASVAAHDADSQARLWKVVRDDGDTVEVESIFAPHDDDLPAALACFVGAADKPVRIHGFARRIDLVPMTTAALHQDFADGTGWSTQPGVAVAVPLLPLDQGEGTASADDLSIEIARVRFEAKVPIGSIGLSLTAPTVWKPARDWMLTADLKDHQRMIERELDLVDATTPLAIDDAAWIDPYYTSTDLLEVQSSVPHPTAVEPKEALLTLQTACVTLRAFGVVDKAKLSSEYHRAQGQPSGLPFSSGRTGHVPKGTRLHWQAGGDAGETLDVLTVDMPHPKDRQVCFPARFVKAALCVDASSVQAAK